MKTGGFGASAVNDEFEQDARKQVANAMQATSLFCMT